MRMEFVERIKKEITKKRPDLIGQKGKKEVSDYAISRALFDEFGIRISVNGLGNYSKLPSMSGRYDVTCGLRKLAGISWETCGKWLDEEFLKGK